MSGISRAYQASITYKPTFVRIKTKNNLRENKRVANINFITFVCQSLSIKYTFLLIYRDDLWRPSANFPLNNVE